MISSSHLLRFHLNLFTCLYPSMGCSVSKFDLEDKVVGPTCEFKPILRRTNNNHATTYIPIATKQSLEDGKKEDIVDSFANNNGRKSLCLTTKDKMFVKKTNVQDREIEREKELEDGHSDEEEIGEDSICFPGSPSFKEYCANGSQDGKDEDCGDGAKSNNKSEKEELLNCDKGSRTQSAKGGRKGRGFRNVLSKGGSSGVKNLLNVNR